MNIDTTVPGSMPTASAPAWRLSVETQALLVRFGVLALLCAGLAVLNENFLTIGNLTNVLRQASLLFIISAGLTLVVIGGGIDLSVGANLTLAACLAAGAMQAGAPAAAGIAIALATATGVGVANGLLIAILRLPPFLVTYGTLWIVSGVALYYMGGMPITGFPVEFRVFGFGFLHGVPIPILVMVMVIAAGSLLLHGTTFGKQLTMAGANRDAAVLSGVPVARNLIAAYSLSGLCVGIGAVIALGRVNSADPGMGEPMLLPCIAVILVGGTSLFGGTGSLLGTALGALLLTFVLNGMNLMAVPSVWQPFVTGVVLVAALAADAYLNSRRR